MRFLSRELVLLVILILPSGCGGGPSRELAGTSWQWESFSGATEEFGVEQPGQYRITFDADGTIGVNADCNLAGGDYSFEGESLSIRVGMSTMALCPSGSRSEQFLDLLGRSTRPLLEVGSLTVELNDGSQMVFSPAEEEAPELSTEVSTPGGQDEELESSELLGSWEWVFFQSMDDTSLEVDDPSRYTLEIRSHGVSLLADCNRGMGGFEVHSSSLRFTEIATTRMACPPGSLADRYLSYLEYVRGWIMEDGHLYLSLMADGGIMEFRPAGADQ